MISPERLDIMQLGWVRLLERYGVTPALAYPVFDVLVSAYQQPHRYYHTLEHIAEMSKIAGRLSDQARDPAAIQLAVWFHDCVYDPRTSGNEAQSSEQMRSLLGPLGIEERTLDAVDRMIMATQPHQNPTDDIDTWILLDADLAILGAEERRYARYAAAIRQEYAFVDDTMYRTGRIRVLESFLERTRIYHTQRMFETGEEAARKNIQSEIERLRS